MANPVLSNPSGKTLTYRKVQDRKKDELYYKELKEEIEGESDHTITLKNGKVIRKPNLAMKRPSAPKKISPRKKNQLIKIYATKRPRKVMKTSRNVGFKSSKSTQKKKNLQTKFEELDIARRNAAMKSSRETLLREEEEEKNA